MGDPWLALTSPGHNILDTDGNIVIWLVVWNIFYFSMFVYIYIYTYIYIHVLGMIIPTDFHIFQRRGSTTNLLLSSGCKMSVLRHFQEGVVLMPIIPTISWLWIDWWRLLVHKWLWSAPYSAACICLCQLNNLYHKISVKSCINKCKVNVVSLNIGYNTYKML